MSVPLSTAITFAPVLLKIWDVIVIDSYDDENATQPAVLQIGHPYQIQWQQNIATETMVYCRSMNGSLRYHLDHLPANGCNGTTCRLRWQPATHFETNGAEYAVVARLVGDNNMRVGEINNGSMPFTFSYGPNTGNPPLSGAVIRPTSQMAAIDTSAQTTRPTTIVTVSLSDSADSLPTRRYTGTPDDAWQTSNNVKLPVGMIIGIAFGATGVVLIIWVLRWYLGRQHQQQATRNRTAELETKETECKELPAGVEIDVHEMRTSRDTELPSPRQDSGDLQVQFEASVNARG